MKLLTMRLRTYCRSSRHTNGCTSSGRTLLQSCVLAGPGGVPNADPVPKSERTWDMALVAVMRMWSSLFWWAIRMVSCQKEKQLEMSGLHVSVEVQHPRECVDLRRQLRFRINSSKFQAQF